MSRTDVAGHDRGGRPGPLLEREHEVAAVEQVLDRVRDGTGSFLLIEGPAGIGKTTLLGEAARRARGRGLLTRFARGGEFEREMPFGVSRELFEPIVERASEDERSALLAGSAHLALLALGQAEPDPSLAARDPFAPIHGLYWLLANLAESQPVTLAIDDAHWADPQTLRFLDYVARRLEELPVLIVATTRSGEPDQPAELRALRHEAHGIHLESLTTSAVSQLIAAELGHDPTPGFAEACSRATAGNPFLLSELLRALQADSVEPNDEMVDAIGAIGPQSVARYALLRLGRFGGEAIALAQAIAVLGGSPQLRHAAALAGLEEPRARTLCDRLREADILAPGLPLDFIHPLIRQAIHRDIGEGERSAAHRRAAEILASAGAGASEIAPHLLACEPNGDPWVVEQLRAAARQAMAEGAHESARTYLERSLLEPPEQDLEDRYLLARALYETDPAAATGALDDVAERAADPAIRVGALRFAALAYVNVGNFPESIRRAEEVLEELREGDREQALALEAQVSCFAAFSRGRDRSSSERIRKVAAGVAGRTPGERLVQQAVALDRFFDADPVEEVVRLASSFPPLPWEAGGMRTPVPHTACKVLSWSGAWPLARDALTEFLDAARGTGRILIVCYSHSFLAETERLSGRLRDAEAEAQTAWEIASAIAPFSAFGLQARMNLLAALTARGDLARAVPLAESLPLSLGPKEFPINPWPIEVRGYLRLAQGDLEGAVEDLLALGEATERVGFLNPAYPPWPQEVAPALAVLGRTTEAQELIRVAEERARAFGAPHVIGTVLRSRALLEPRKRQLETLRESVGALEVRGPPHELARSLFELGAALRRRGGRGDAREPLRQALDLAHRCGAGALEERARDELVATGARPRRAYTTGVGSLTASELRTAKLAAAGLNNREIAERLFVSRRTVETHLTHIYEKLQIGGRRELPRVLAEETGAR
ncbi:MAG TPA: AAA family ATPase [Actinomycetota bacterium]|nr:AAA family ATPase [Actinomycetota bacterium]